MKLIILLKKIFFIFYNTIFHSSISSLAGIGFKFYNYILLFLKNSNYYLIFIFSLSFNLLFFIKILLILKIIIAYGFIFCIYRLLLLILVLFQIKCIFNVLDTIFNFINDLDLKNLNSWEGFREFINKVYFKKCIQIKVHQTNDVLIIKNKSISILFLYIFFFILIFLIADPILCNPINSGNAQEAVNLICYNRYLRNEVRERFPEFYNYHYNLDGDSEKFCGFLGNNDYDSINFHTNSELRNGKKMLIRYADITHKESYKFVANEIFSDRSNFKLVKLGQVAFQFFVICNDYDASPPGTYTNHSAYLPVKSFDVFKMNFYNGNLVNVEDLIPRGSSNMECVLSREN